MPILGIMASQISGHLWAPEGAYDSLATVTISGTAASVTFAGIPAGYKHLQIRWVGFNNDTTNSGIGNVRTSAFFNGDTTQTNYYSHELKGNGALASATAENSSKSGGNSTRNSQIGGAANVVDILDYASTVKNKTVRTLTGYNNNDTDDVAQSIRLISGFWNNTAAITSIQLLPESGAFKTYTTFALYGVK